MSGTAMVVWIVALSLVYGVIAQYLKTRHAHPRQEPDAELEAEVADLRTRVEVLERILTDDRHRLAQEIERLG